MQIAEQVSHKRGNVTVLEFVEQVASTEAVHLSDAKRPTPEQLQKNYRILSDFSLPPTIDAVIILDDVLTTGSHFKAIKNMLLEKYPNLSDVICGLFIAKVIR